MKNFKKYLDKVSGKEVHNVKVTVRSPYDSKRTRLSFDLEVESAFLSGDFFTISFNVSNRLVNDENDEAEFEYLFKKPTFQEELGEDTYDFYKLQILGVNLADVEMTFKYK